MPTILRSNGVKRRIASGYGPVGNGGALVNPDAVMAKEYYSFFNLPIDFFPSMVFIRTKYDSYSFGDPDRRYSGIFQIGNQYAFVGGTYKSSGFVQEKEAVTPLVKTSQGFRFNTGLIRAHEGNAYWVAIE